MKALAADVLLRFLLNDDRTQGRRALKLFEDAEARSDRFLITAPVLLEMLWVLTAVHDLSRADVIHALELLTQMPILEFEDYDGALKLIRLGRSTKAPLPDILIGLSARSRGCDATLSFDRSLARTGLTESV